jgi:hypothetical protein
MTSPTGGWQGETFAHEAFFYDEDAQAVTRCVPFVLEAFERGEDVTVVASERVRQALAEALGGDVDRIAVLDAPERWWQGVTHPMTWDGCAPTSSPGYLPTAAYLRSVEPEWTARPAAARTVPVISARGAREVATEVARAHGANGRTDDMVIAINELWSPTRCGQPARPS